MGLDISIACEVLLVDDLSIVCEVNVLSMLILVIEVIALPSFKVVIMGIESCNPLVDEMMVVLVTVTIGSST